MKQICRVRSSRSACCSFVYCRARALQTSSGAVGWKDEACLVTCSCLNLRPASTERAFLLTLVASRDSSIRLYSFAVVGAAIPWNCAIGNEHISVTILLVWPMPPSGQTIQEGVKVYSIPVESLVALVG